ncbi:8-oxo-dGTP diphosphatase [Cytobacillus eiseniae]|uniref:8-oxo-dGTP diphosphatase n=1 Tax=Cytobacillus eiseniae TaxID=762947 RepID=A0ABS4RKT4_9BACI|nr:8-oxo-dGTP diphosphatase [Cytobacillus eiseniae]
MKTFTDANGGFVRLAFTSHAFDQRPAHVLVIGKKDGKWLLTKHKIRGLEFPGGKIENGETIEEAARREVFEETGATVSSIRLIGEYEVTLNGESFVKAICYCVVDELKDNEHYFETNGPVLVEGNLLELRWGVEYSFIMKDQVTEESIARIERLD